MYLIFPGEQSCVGGFHFFHNKDIRIFSAPVLVLATVEAEFGAPFLNVQDLIPIQTTAIEMGWPQPITPLKKDNSTVHIGLSIGPYSKKDPR